MKIFLKHIIKPFAGNQNGIYIFNFHQISRKIDHGLHTPGCFTNTAYFIKFIQHLRNNYKIISIDEAINRNKNKEIDQKFASITFDDGDASIKKAIEICTTEKIHASFFINTAYIFEEKIDPFRISSFIKNNTASTEEINKILAAEYCLRKTLDRNLYEKAKNYLLNYSEKLDKIKNNLYVDKDFIQNTKSKYISFGLHGHEHERFILLSKEEQINSLKININYLKSLNNYLPIFAIPFGRALDWNHDTISACIELELDFMFADGGINKGDSVGLKRIPSDNRKIINEVKFETK